MTDGDTGLTAQQLRLLRLLQAAIDAGRPMPSYQEACQALGLKSRSNIFRILTELEGRGYVRMNKHQARGTTLLKRVPPEASDLRPGPWMPLQTYEDGVRDERHRCEALARRAADSPEWHVAARNAALSIAESIEKGEEP